MFFSPAHVSHASFYRPGLTRSSSRTTTMRWGLVVVTLATALASAAGDAQSVLAPPPPAPLPLALIPGFNNCGPRRETRGRPPRGPDPTLCAKVTSLPAGKNGERRGREKEGARGAHFLFSSSPLNPTIIIPFSQAEA